jgi:hypothetical protein
MLNVLRNQTGLFLAAFAVFAAPAHAAAPGSASIVVAAANSSDREKAIADFVADGQADQQEINAAIQALPPAGGTVELLAGTFNIEKIEGTLGGVLIERSHVTLAGQGEATKLILAAGQNTNVVRIIGSGVGNVTIRDLWIDANRAENDQLRGDPNVAHDRFEVCGIKAFRRAPGSAEVPDNTHDITVRNCTVKNAQRLNIMLEGPNMRVVDNVLGNAGSDSVEILTGPGLIRGNYVEITGQTHVAIGSDRGNAIIMSENVVHVLDGGRLDIGFRSWSDSRQHVISSNIVTVEPGGNCKLAMDVRGDGAAVTGNSVQSPQSADRMRLKIAGGNTVVTANLLENTILEINDETGRGLPIRLSANILHESSVEVLAGEVSHDQSP